MSKIYHPDKNNNRYDEDYYKEITVAYDILSKEKSKLDYDLKCRKIKIQDKYFEDFDIQEEVKKE